jgi:chromosome segregation ATPase
MIVEYNHLIDNFKYKIRKLISLYTQQKDEINVLKQERNNLTKQIEERDLKIDQLKEEIVKLKIAKSITTSDEESQEAKQKINKLVREIDKCIALLNR